MTLKKSVGPCVLIGLTVKHRLACLLFYSYKDYQEKNSYPSHCTLVRISLCIK